MNDESDPERERGPARRRRRLSTLGLGAAAAAVVVLTVATSNSPQQQQLPGRPSVRPTPSVPRPPSGGMALWPTAWSTPGWADDPVQVVQHLLDDYLRLPATATAAGASGRGGMVNVPIVTAGRAVAVARVEQLAGSDGPWAVTGAASENITVTAPGPGASAFPPLTITGTVHSDAQSVHLRLLAGTPVAEADVPAATGRPWRQTLTWGRTDWAVGALVASTYDGKGDLSALAVLPVRRGDGNAFVAREREHIALVDLTSGRTLRQLSHPLGGDVDSSPSLGGGDVVWVRTHPDGCTSAIMRTPLAHGPATTVVAAKPVARSLATLSHDGHELAWLERPCTGGLATVVVRDGTARLVTVTPAPPGVVDLVVGDDGRLVVWGNDRVVVVTVGGDVASARRLPVARGCSLDAPAWDGTTVVAWQRCAQRQQLVRFVAGADRPLAGPVLTDEPPVMRTRFADGVTLLSFINARIAQLVGGGLLEVPSATRLSQPSR